MRLKEIITIGCYMLSPSSEVIFHISKPNVNAPVMTRPRACVLRQGM